MVGYLGQETTIDVNVHDTYIVIDTFYFAILISLLLFILCIVYWVMIKVGLKPAKTLVWMHLGITYLGGFLALLFSKFFKEELQPYKYTLALTILVVVFCQALLVINILIGLFNMRRQTNG